MKKNPEEPKKGFGLKQKVHYKNHHGQNPI
jgi:hypothetical protein